MQTPRVLPPVLSSTVVNNTKATTQPSLPRVNNQLSPAIPNIPSGTLPHSAFEDHLPSSIPKPGQITGLPLQQLMGLQDHTPIYNLIRVRLSWSISITLGL